MRYTYDLSHCRRRGSNSQMLTWIFNKAAPLNGGSRFFHT